MTGQVSVCLGKVSVFPETRGLGRVGKMFQRTVMGSQPSLVDHLVLLFEKTLARGLIYQKP